jgi:hypothetical protein
MCGSSVAAAHFSAMRASVSVRPDRIVVDECLPSSLSSKRRGRVPGYIRDMVDRPDRACVPIEMEMLPLYREPRGHARLRREHKREQRLNRREQNESPTRAERLLARLAPRTSAATRRRRS